MSKEDEYWIKHAAFSNPAADSRNDTFYSLLSKVSIFLEALWPNYVQDITFRRDDGRERGYPSPEAVVYYDDLVGEDLDLRKEMKEHAKRIRLCEALSEQTFIKGDPFNCLVVRMPQGDDQDSIPKLLLAGALAIKNIDDTKIRHIIFDQFSDEDVIDNPNLSFYFES